MTQPPSNKRKTLYSIIALIVGMFGLAYGSVPLYDMFCRLTGFDGTTQRALKAPDHMLKREMTVRFNADVAQDLDWEFKPEELSTNLHVGEERLAFFVARNMGDKPVEGTAIFNVTPAKAGMYFNKIQCFCFEKQLIKPGQEIRFPVSFFIDPSIIDDENMDDVQTITLSYTFFQVKGS